MVSRRPPARIHTFEVMSDGQCYHGTYKVDDRRITVTLGNDSASTVLGFSDPAAIARTMLLNLIARSRRAGGQ
jgi:hypothetical protein